MTRCLACQHDDIQKKVYDHHHLNLLDGSVPSLEFVAELVPEHFIFKGFVEVCNKCGYGILQSIPTDSQLSAFYNGAFWGRENLAERVAKASAGYFSSVHLARAKQQQEFLGRYIELNTVSSCLEIGAGDALLSQALKNNARPDTLFHICEPGNHWDRYYQTIGVNKIADFFPFSSPHEPYDLIVASHWLEHIPQVIETLQTLKSKLAAKGKLFIEVPNTAHDYWQLDLKDTPHIHFFTQSSLTMMAEQAGFRVLAIGEFGITLAEHVAGKKPSYDELSEKPKGYSLAAILE